MSEIFAYVPQELTAAERARLSALGKNADAAGIELAALGGEPEWALDHAAALSWLRTAMGTGLFTTAHVDVEPYHLPAWRTDRAGTVASFTALLAKLRDADPRPLEADVPFWYHTIPAGPSGSASSASSADSATLADEVLARTDAVTVMSYRDTATGPGSIMEISADMLRRGQRAGRPVRLGAETLRLPDCPHCTFHDRGREAMDAALAEVDAAAAEYPPSPASPFTTTPPGPPCAPDRRAFSIRPVRDGQGRRQWVGERSSRDIAAVPLGKCRPADPVIVVIPGRSS
nr:hypothetical protein GCM10020093_119470 [Planobispora longispora]